MTSEKKIQHEDDGYASQVERRGEDDNDLCDRHHFFIFKGVMTRREKRTRKKQGTHLQELYQVHILKETMKTMEKQDMSVVLTFECCSQAPQLITPQLERSRDVWSGVEKTNLG